MEGTVAMVMPKESENESTLYGLFLRRAAEHPEHEAVRDARTSLTYGELADRVAVLASSIRMRRLEIPSRIALHFHRGVDLVAAVLAVASVGHTYVPLDPAYPKARLRFMVEDSEASLVLSDCALPDGLSDVPALRVDLLDWTPRPVEHVTGPVAPAGTIAYVIYTSGSTGRPKGVAVPQENVVAMVRGVCSVYDFSADDVWTLFHSYCFDFSVWEMWGALSTGAVMVIVPSETALSPRATAELLAREHVTVMNIVPSVFRYLVAALKTMSVPRMTLRRIIFGGESIDVAEINQWRSRYGDSCQFVNTYGITEATVFVSTRTLLPADLDEGDDEAARELGTPLPGWEFHVLDGSDQPVGRGETGEIWVAGHGVAAGYLGRPELTAERFRELALPGREPKRMYGSGDLATRTQNDTFCFAGRRDDQVKINGFRIELGEVERTLRQLPEVRDAAVLHTRSRVGAHMLTAYVVADPHVTNERIIRQAQDALPRHMIPGKFHLLTDLPRNASGKIDRRALADVGGGRAVEGSLNRKKDQV